MSIARQLITKTVAKSTPQFTMSSALVRNFHKSRQYRQEEEGEGKKQEIPEQDFTKYKIHPIWFALAAADVAFFAIDVMKKSSRDGVAEAVAATGDKEDLEQRVVAYECLAKDTAYVYARDSLVRENAIDAFISGLNDSERRIRLYSLEGLANLAKSGAIGEAVLAKAGVVDAAKKAIALNDREAELALRLLSSLAISAKNHSAIMSAVSQSDVVAALRSPSKHVGKEAAQLVAYLAANPANQAALVAAGAKEGLRRCKKTVYVSTASKLLEDAPASAEQGLAAVDGAVSSSQTMGNVAKAAVMGTVGTAWVTSRWYAYVHTHLSGVRGIPLATKMLPKGLVGGAFVAGATYLNSHFKNSIEVTNMRQAPSSSDTTAASYDVMARAALLLGAAQLSRFVYVPFYVVPAAWEGYGKISERKRLAKDYDRRD